MENKLSGLESPSILYVDDDQESADLLKATLPEYRLVFARIAFDAIRSINNDVFDAYILDYWLPGWSGVQLCRQIRKLDPHGPVLFCTGATREPHRRRALKAGASAYLCKPIDPELLRWRVEGLKSLADSESVNASVHARHALDAAFDEFTHKLAALGRQDEPSIELLERAARSRVYAVFAAHRGTRANFERWWPEAFRKALASRKVLSGAEAAARETRDAHRQGVDASMRDLR